MNIRVHVQGIMSLICGLALLGSLVHAQKCEAGTYYVATDGSDSNPGTEAQPFQTLGRGVRDLGPGDILLVKNGTYNGGELTYTPSGASWGSPVTIKAYGGHSPAIGYLYFDRSSYIVIDGFVIDGIKITWGGGVADHIRIRNSDISPRGIFVTEGSDGNEFIHLQVHHTDGHGIYLAGSSGNTIEDCSIYDNTGLGVHAWHSTGTGVNRNIITDNIISNNGGGGILLSTGSGNEASHNDIGGNNGIGIRVDYGASDTYVGYNTIHGNSYGGIFIGASCSDTRVESNNIYDTDWRALIDEGISTSTLP